MKNKALVLVGEEKLELQDWDMPQPKDNEARIRIKVCSICGSDLGAYRHPTERFQPPLVLGHEFSGVIDALGGKVTRFKVGQRVTSCPILYCQECYYCKRGDINLCSHRRSIGTAIGGTRTHGAMEEYMLIREEHIIPLRNELSFEEGAMLEPSAVCLAAAKRGHTADEVNVHVMGVGPIGLLIVKFLKSLGVKNVMVSDILPARLEKAKACGASLAFNVKDSDPVAEVKKATGGVGADRVIIAAGVGPAIKQAFDMVRNGGTVSLVALMHEKVEFDPMELVGRGINFIGSYMFTTEMKEAMDLIADGKMTVKDLITSSFPLERGQDAFKALIAPGNNEIKVQIVTN
jgi:threonine dehydrogenase-like Zn-dependent dehydrogenase